MHKWTILPGTMLLKSAHIAMSVLALRPEEAKIPITTQNSRFSHKLVLKLVLKPAIFATKTVSIHPMPTNLGFLIRPLVVLFVVILICVILVILIWHILRGFISALIHMTMLDMLHQVEFVFRNHITKATFLRLICMYGIQVIY